MDELESLDYVFVSFLEEELDDNEFDGRELDNVMVGFFLK